MSWILFGVSMVIFDSLKDILTKRTVRTVNVYVMAAGMRLLVAVLLLPIVLYTGQGIQSTEFWIVFVITAALNTAANLFYLKALKAGDLSLVLPMIAFVPLLITGVAPLLIGEIPTPLGFLSILLVVIGSYVLQIKQRAHGFFAPLTALVREPGTRYMLGVALIWSVTSVLDKIGVQHSSPLVWVFAINLGVGISTLPLLFYNIQKSKKTVRSIFVGTSAAWPSILAVAVFAALALFSQMSAIQQTQVAYVLSFKRLSIVLSVLAGYAIFKERGFRERLIGTVLMVVGVMLLLLVG